MSQDDPNIPKPLGIPESILKRAGAIDLYRVAVWALAAVAVLCVVGIVALAMMGREPSNELASLGTTALVGLVAMVAPQRGG